MAKEISAGALILEVDGSGIAKLTKLTDEQLKRLNSNVNETNRTFAQTRSNIRLAQKAAYTYSARLKDLNNAYRAGLITQKEYNNSLKEARTELSKTEGATKLYESRAKSTTKSVGLLSSAFVRLGGAFAAISGAKSLINIGDNVKLLDARLLAATGSQEAFNDARAEALRITRESRSDLESTVELYAKIAASASQYGIEQEKIATTVESVTYGLKLFGASAAEVASTQTQLAQALASGVLQGDEFKSMAEASPRLMQAMADGIGVARSELKQMAADGMLTTDVVVNALSNQATILKDEFSKMPLTVAEAWGQLKNEFTLGVAEFNKASGVTTTLAEGIMVLANNMDVLTVSVASLGSALSVFAAYRYLPGLFMSIAGAVKTLSIAIRANPIGVIVTAIGALIGYLVTLKDKITPVSNSFVTLSDYASAAFNYVKNRFNDVKQTVSEFMTKWSEFLARFTELSPTAQATFDTVSGYISLFFQAVKQNINWIIGAYQGAFNAIVIIFKKLPATMYNILANVTNYALGVINKMVSGIANALNYLPGIDINVGDGVFDEIKLKAVDTSQSVTEAFSSAFNRDYMGELGNNIAGKTDDIIKSFQNVGSAWTAEAQKIAQIRADADWDGLFDEVENESNNAVSAINAVSASTEKLNGATKEAAKSAKDLHNSFVSGIESDYKKIVESLLTDSERLEKSFREQQSVLESMRQLGKISYETYDEVNTKLIDQHEEAMDQIQDGSTESADVFQTQFERAIESVDQSFADMWKSALTNGEITFDSLKDAATNLAAELLHSVTTAPLTQFFSGGLGGATGDTPKKEDTIKGLGETLSNGLESLSDQFSEFFKKVPGISDDLAKSLGSGATAGIIGAGLGGAVASAMGDNSGTTQLVSGIAAAGAQMAAVASGLAGLAATGVGAVVAVAVAAVMAASGRDKTSESKYEQYYDGSLRGTRSRDLEQSISQEPIEAFWAAVNKSLNKYGAELSDNLLAGLRVKNSDEGLRWLLGLDNSSGESLFGSELTGDNVNEENIMTEIAKLQIAALKEADWSGVSDAVQKGFDLITKGEIENLDAQSTSELYAWIDAMVDNEKGMRYVIDTFNETIQKFDGTIDEFKDFTNSTYDIFKRLGESGIDDLNNYLTEQNLIGEGGIQASLDKIRADIMSDYQEQLDAINDKRVISHLSNDYMESPDSVYTQDKKDAEIAALEEWLTKALEDAINQVSLDGTEITRITKNFNALTFGMRVLEQASNVTGSALVGLSDSVIQELGGAEDALAVFNNILSVTASETHKAGLLYESYKQQIDTLNQAMGLAGNNTITTTDQLWNWVSALDPASDAYAEQMTWANKMATALSNAADSSAYFTDAIDNVNDSLNDTMRDIREDLMSDQELYNSRKEEAERLAASIASLTNVEDITSVTDQVNKLVSDMWSSLSEDQQNASTGDWMLSFLEELKTLSAGRIAELQNNYGADNQLSDDYNNIQNAVNNDDDEESSNIVNSQIESLAQISAENAHQQNQAAQTMLEGSSNISTASESLAQTAETMRKVADKMNTALSNINIDLDVYNHNVSSEVG